MTTFKDLANQPPATDHYDENISPQQLRHLEEWWAAKKERALQPPPSTHQTPPQ